MSTYQIFPNPRAAKSGYRKGERVIPSGAGRTKRWPRTPGTVVSARGGSVFVRWDGTGFEDQMAPSEVRRMKPAANPSFGLRHHSVGTRKGARRTRELQRQIYADSPAAILEEVYPGHKARRAAAGPRKARRNPAREGDHPGEAALRDTGVSYRFRWSGPLVHPETFRVDLWVGSQAQETTPSASTPAEAFRLAMALYRRGAARRNPDLPTAQRHASQMARDFGRRARRNASVFGDTPKKRHAWPADMMRGQSDRYYWGKYVEYLKEGRQGAAEAALQAQIDAQDTPATRRQVQREEAHYGRAMRTLNRRGGD